MLYQISWRLKYLPAIPSVRRAQISLFWTYISNLMAWNRLHISILVWIKAKCSSLQAILANILYGFYQVKHCWAKNLFLYMIVLMMNAVNYLLVGSKPLT